MGMGILEVFYRCFVGSSYIRLIFVLYSSYIKPSKWVGNSRRSEGDI